jgi:hypothetical protein
MSVLIAAAPGRRNLRKECGEPIDNPDEKQKIEKVIPGTYPYCIDICGGYDTDCWWKTCPKFFKLFE